MYLLACIPLLISYIKIDSYVINVGDVTDPHPPDHVPVPNGLLLKYVYCLLLTCFQ